ncbi:TIGR03915 family putative DNA repair protein [Flagellimonas flava]|uniref:Probable DNA metabolism protein n=1 Tax=Flagellimonas flava TaxID=570519 RepID=A0A1M5IHT1_9FLAO|nr:TIGR03915 family putative DNA repair protein [Allomuricauda flava]SHG27806.1 probable DNA metabolism protein [Allomuricauda flava]
MNSTKTLLYDGTFNGFLTLIYMIFDKKWSVIDIQKKDFQVQGLFTDVITVETNTILAKKVWYGINKKNHMAMKRIYYAFLSEDKHIEMNLYHYICHIMGTSQEVMDTEQLINQLELLSAKVGKEKRRVEAFAQFQLAQQQGEVAHIKPKYNVLPLLSKHLRQMNKGIEWQVFDDRRKYGVRYSSLGLELFTSKPMVLEAV